MEKAKPSYQDLEKRILELESKIKKLEQKKDSNAESELKNVPEEVKKHSDSLFKRLFETSPFGILICEFIKDKTGKVTDFIHLSANKATATQTGYKLKQIVGKKAGELLPPEELKELMKIYAPISVSGKIVKYSHYFDLYKRTLEVTAFPLRDDYFIINFNNITERKKAEKELKKKNQEYFKLYEEYKQQFDEMLILKNKAEESDRLKTEFFNNMSHEIRTPLNGIMGFADFLTQPGISDSKRKHYVKIIRNSGKQLLRIIDDILEISKLETKQIKAIEKEICLNEFLLQMFSIFDIKAKENKTPLYLKKSLKDSESNIITDELKLNKIIGNLLENALKFTTEGYIEIGYHVKENIQPPVLEIYIKDTGIGINPDNQELIFERFTQEEKEISQKMGGLGLGLSIARENAQLLGGKISLNSKKGKGTTFYINLPYKPASSNIIESKKRNDGTQEEKPYCHKILIAEDEEVNYLYIETILMDSINLNCELFHAKNGQEAIDFCKKMSTIDLVFMDLKMPKVNGYEATKQIRKLCPNVPIIAQTAYSTDADKKKAIDAGCDEFITKPIKSDNLIKITKSYLIQN